MPKTKKGGKGEGKGEGKVLKLTSFWGKKTSPPTAASSSSLPASSINTSPGTSSPGTSSPGMSSGYYLRNNRKTSSSSSSSSSSSGKEKVSSNDKKEKENVLPNYFKKTPALNANPALRVKPALRAKPASSSGLSKKDNASNSEKPSAKRQRVPKVSSFTLPNPNDFFTPRTKKRKATMPCKDQGSQQDSSKAEEDDPELPQDVILAVLQSLAANDNVYAACERLLLTVGCPKGHPLREEVKPHLQAFLSTAKKHHHWLDPKSPLIKHLIVLALKQNGGCYARYSARGKLKKIGSAGYFAKRQIEAEKEQPGIAPLVPIFDHDNITWACEDDFQVDYDAMQETLLHVTSPTGPALDAFLYRFFEVLFEEGGDVLGFKKGFTRQAIECGGQQENDLGCPMKFLTPAEPLLQSLFLETQLEAEPIYSVLASRFQGKLNDPECFVHFLLSWEPGFKGHNSTLEAVRCILGTDDIASFYTNPIDYPPIKDAKTATEMYGITAYEAKDWAYGRKRAAAFMLLFLAAKYGLAVFDSNNIIFRDDPNSGYKDASAFIKSYNFRIVVHHVQKITGTPYYSQISLFVNKDGTHYILLVGPICLAGYRLKQVPMVYKVQRGFDVCVLTNVFRFLDGKKPLSVEDRFRNPVFGMVALQVVQNCYHLDGRYAVAFYKHFLSSGQGVNHLFANGLAKNERSDAPISYNNRNQLREPKVQRAQLNTRLEDDKLINKQARVIICNSTLESLPQTYDALMVHFQRGKGDVSTRFRDTLAQFVQPNSATDQALWNLRRDNTDNSGNPEARGKTDEEIISNASSFAELVVSHGPSTEDGSTGTPFWIAETTLSHLKVPTFGTKSVCGQYTYPGQGQQNYMTYTTYVRDGMRQALKGYLSENRRNNTNDVTIRRYGDLSLQGVKEGSASNSPTVRVYHPDAPIKNSPRGTPVKQGFLLMQLHWDG